MSNIKFILLILIIILNVACILDNNEDEDEFIYPLNIGNVWEYSRQWSLYYYSDSLELKEYSDTVTFSSEISVSITDKVTLNGNIDTYKMVGIENDGTYNPEQIHYYRNNRDGLYLYAYQAGGTIVLPKKISGSCIQFQGMQFNDFNELSKYVQSLAPIYHIQSDTLYFEDSPRKIIHYPLEIGKQWTYRRAGDPWQIDRIVTGRVEVDIDVGTFDCYTIKFIYDLNNDDIWDENIWIMDYVSKEGLIERVVYALGLEETTINHPEGTGRHFDATDKYILTNYNIENTE